MAIAHVPAPDAIAPTLEWLMDPFSKDHDIYAFGDIFFAHVHFEPGFRAEWEVEVNWVKEKGTELSVDRARAAAKKTIRRMLKELDHRVPYAIRRGDLVSLVFQPAIRGTVEAFMVDENDNQWVKITGEKAQGWWLLKDLVIVERSRYHVTQEPERLVLTERKTE